MAHNAAVRAMVDAGQLGKALPESAQIQQYIANAEGMFADATRAENSRHERFTLAYEGIHSLAMAFLLYFGARPGGGDGHRVKALQIYIQQVGLNSHFRLLDEIHNVRNNLTYDKPSPPVSQALMNSTIALLSDCIVATRKAVAESL